MKIIAIFIYNFAVNLNAPFPSSVRDDTSRRTCSIMLVPVPQRFNTRCGRYTSMLGSLISVWRLNHDRQIRRSDSVTSFSQERDFFIQIHYVGRMQSFSMLKHVVHIITAWFSRVNFWQISTNPLWCLNIIISPMFSYSINSHYFLNVKCTFHGHTYQQLDHLLVLHVSTLPGSQIIYIKKSFVV
jgi:hypothetical protein